MKRIFTILSIVGILFLFIISIITVDEPFKWVDLSMYSHLKFIYYWLYYCCIYLSSIWFIYWVINKALIIIDDIKVKKLYKGSRY